MVALWLLSLVFASSPVPVLEGSAGRAAARDSWGMTVIAELPFGLAEAVPCGDADRDGHREFYAREPASPFRGYAVEHVRNNCFDSTRLTDDRASYRYLGDADRDGKADLVVLGGAFYVRESPDSFSLPTVPVWVESTIGNFLPQITDLDLDSAREILVCSNDWLVVKAFECTGDNRYELRCVLPGMVYAVQYPAVQTMDMDRDGVPELAVGCEASVAFAEAVGNDSLVWRDSVRLIDDPYCHLAALAAAPDLDHDGRTELLASCEAYGLRLFKIAVLESRANDSFEVVWADTIDGGGSSASLAVGDVDGDSTLEFLATNDRCMRLYRCTSNDRYECFWHSDSGYGAATLYDINSDGRDELIHSFGHQPPRTVIREWLPVGIEERIKSLLQRVSVSPSVVRRNEVVRVTGLPQSGVADVVDASGRVITSLASGVWHPASSVAGTYFIRIHAGSQAVVRKVLVVE